MRSVKWAGASYTTRYYRCSESMKSQLVKVEWILDKGEV